MRSHFFGDDDDLRCRWCRNCRHRQRRCFCAQEADANAIVATTIVTIAIQSLRKALVVAPDYVDAMFNLALLLQRKGAYPEAADYWRQYLANDCLSEWSARARRSLKFCEIQVNSLGSPASEQAA
jgi:hypothetical protein